MKKLLMVLVVMGWGLASAPLLFAQSFHAQLVDKEAKALKSEATVRVDVQGLEMVDPADSGEKARSGEGHLHYQINGGPIIATTATKLSFHQLPAGNHRITVSLAGNDHAPIGLPQTLDVAIGSTQTPVVVTQPVMVPQQVVLTQEVPVVILKTEDMRNFEGTIVKVDYRGNEIVVRDTTGKERRVMVKQGMIGHYKVDDRVKIELMTDMKEARMIRVV